jgi:hypothetical protein
MAKANKSVVITLISVLAVCTVVFLGYSSFVSSIRNQRTCEWANIDNIELHAHIDVPKVTTWDCDYEKAVNTKKAHFTIAQKDFDLNGYIQMYNLKELTSDSKIAFDRFLHLKRDSVTSADYYYKKGYQDGEKWEVLLDKSTGKLWVTIQYKD